MEKMRIQQEQTLGALDTKIDAMMERRFQAFIYRLDGLLGNRSGENSGEPSRESRVNFMERPNRRRTYGYMRGRGCSSSNATGDIRLRGPNIRGNSTGNRPTSNERPTQDTHATGRRDSVNWVMRIKEEVIQAIRTEEKAQSIYQMAMMHKRGIHGTQHEWPQPLNL